jgi:hypothetical protein
MDVHPIGRALLLRRRVGEDTADVGDRPVAPEPGERELVQLFARVRQA